MMPLGADLRRVARAHLIRVDAGDEQAAAIERVCVACGVRVLRMPPSLGQYKPKDTVAVVALADLVKRVGERLSIEVLRVLAEADLAPITAIHLCAEAILIGDDLRDQVDPCELTRAIVTLGDKADKERRHAGLRSPGHASLWRPTPGARRPERSPGCPRRRMRPAFGSGLRAPSAFNYLVPFSSRHSA